MYRNHFKEQGEEVWQFHCSANGLLLWDKRESQTVGVYVHTQVHQCIYVCKVCVFEYFACVCVCV